MPRLEDSMTGDTQRSRLARLRDRLPDSANALLVRGEDLWYRLTPLQQLLVGIGGCVLFVVVVLGLAFHSRILMALAPYVAAWRDSKAGWLVIWVAVILVSFPPLIGYAMCVTLAGFVFGVWRGYLIVATATVVGATTSFLVCRYVLQGYVQRMTKNDKRFEALALTLKHDGIKLLIMIRLCPLPYSLSNGAISAIPTVTPANFALANLISTPKLLVGCFIGSRLGLLAQDGGDMDTKTKIVSWISIIVGIMIGIGTGWFMYKQTQKRARELEELEQGGQAGDQPRRTVRRPNDLEAAFNDDEDDNYLDDAADRAAAAALVRGADGISLHTTAEDEYRDSGDAAYRDEWADDGDLGADASNLEDVFDAGDDEDDELPSPTRSGDVRTGKGW